MNKEDDFINKSICKSHYLSLGWDYVDDCTPYDIFSDNAFIYLCLILDGVSFNSPLRVSKRELFLDVKRGVAATSCSVGEANPMLFSRDAIFNLASSAISHYMDNSQQERRDRFRQGMLSNSNIHLLFIFKPSSSLGGFDFFVNISDDYARSGVLLSRDDVSREIFKLGLLEN